MALTPPVEDADIEEDPGYYFRLLGGIQFAKHEAPIGAAGCSRLLACAPTYGLTVFSDLSGARCALRAPAGIGIQVHGLFLLTAHM